MSLTQNEAALKAEITHLKTALATALARPLPSPSPLPSLHTPHPLLLLSDSALPLGSFAYSSSLESYLSHHPLVPPISLFPHFLHLSLLSLSTATLPYLTTAFRYPEHVLEIDDRLDACSLCPVARKASVSQGRALMAVWERSFRATVPPSAASAVLAKFAAAMKGLMGLEEGGGVPHAHLPPLFAVVSQALGLTMEQMAYVYLFNHAKSVVSAAVRKGVMGPYQAQGILAGGWLRGEIEGGLEHGWGKTDMEGNTEDGLEEWEKGVDGAGQSVPMMEVWGGRHEMVYSRMFVS